MASPTTLFRSDECHTFAGEVQMDWNAGTRVDEETPCRTRDTGPILTAAMWSCSAEGIGTNAAASRNRVSPAGLAAVKQGRQHSGRFGIDCRQQSSQSGRVGNSGEDQVQEAV